MPVTGAAIHHEDVYSLLLHERWDELLDVLHKHRSDIAGDALLSHAVDVFIDAFFEKLDQPDFQPASADLEKLFLLHSGRFYRFSDRQFEAVVERLVEIHRDQPEIAVGYARHCPQNAACASVLSRHDLRQAVPHAQDHRIRLNATRSDVQADHTIRLFRSRQEETFFMAVREVFAAYFAYPNVALSSLIDFERVQPMLSGEEREYFFRAVVDCVVFDQHDGYIPKYFFELDSAHHDEARQRNNDRMKDHILAVAGKNLLRIRLRDQSADREAFIRMLREVVRS